IAGKKKFSEILDKETLERELAVVIADLTDLSKGSNGRSSRFQQDVQLATNDVVNQFVELLQLNLETETKDVILDLLIKTVIYSLETNSEELVVPIEVKKMVRKEIMKMNARKIEDMFAFGRPIFNTLIFYEVIRGSVGVFIRRLVLYKK